MNQPELDFDGVPNYRNTDPRTSMNAGRSMDESGARGCQAERVLQAATQFPVRTAPELAAIIGDLDRYQVNRRLADLEAKGLVVKRGTKVDPATGRENVTWDVR